MKSIPFFNYSSLFNRDKQEILPIIEDVLSRGAYVMQQELFNFEENLADYLNVKHVIGVADGTVAIMMGLRAAGIGPGDEVLVPSHTFVATAAAVHHVGAKPVLVDCGSDHLMSSDDLNHRITSRTKAILPVQLNGRTANMDGIVFFAEQHGLKIVEDSAQALGSKFKGQFAGTFGIAGTCSFYPSKTLGCFGDGGAVFTNDDGAAEILRLLRDHGRARTGDVVAWGYNSRLDNLQAAVLNFKLARYDAEVERRRNIAARYEEKLCGLPDLLLPPGPNADVRHFDIYQNYEVESDQRDALRAHLDDAGVKTIIQWGGKTLHQFPKLELNTDLPHTQRLTERFFLLPMNTSLSDDDIDYICEQIQRFYL